MKKKQSIFVVALVYAAVMSSSVYAATRNTDGTWKCDPKVDTAGLFNFPGGFSAWAECKGDKLVYLDDGKTIVYKTSQPAGGGGIKNPPVIKNPPLGIKNLEAETAFKVPLNAEQTKAFEQAVKNAKLKSMVVKPR